MHAIFCAIALACAGAFAQDAFDLDADGLDDGFEQFLIDEFRPVLVFDTGQSYWPLSILDFVTNSVVRDNDDDATIRVTNAVLRVDPLAALDAVDPSMGERGFSHGGYYPDELSNLALDPFDSIHRGQPAGSRVGAYAKVSVLQQPTIYPSREGRPVGRAGDYFIQYWQLFAFNDDCTICLPVFGCIYDGDHEGDWIYIDVYVDPATLSIREIVHHHHGGSCAVSIQPDEWPIPVDDVPVGYLEQNVNEWWPHPSVDDCTVVPGYADCAIHSASGLSYRMEGVLNVGERFFPMPDVEAQLFTLFNGDWGHYKDGPNPPVMQRWVTTPHSVVFLDARSSARPSVNLGTVFNPFASVQTALDRARDVVGASHLDHCDLRFSSGEYSFTGVLDVPGTLHSEGGPVTIGN